jgi:hypothetical protein
VIHQKLQLVFTENLSSERKLAVVDGFGRMLYQETIPSEVIEKQIHLPVLPSGIYMVWVSFGRYSQTQRFVMP